MTQTGLSRTTLGLLLFAAAILVFFLFSSVRIAGAADAPAALRPDAKKAGAPKKALDKALDVKGQLDDNDPNDPAHNQPCKTYMVKLEKGKTYVIDMVSTDFDTYLRLENAQGDQLAEDDDSGGKLNAQIVFTPEADDTFKIVATRFAEGTGNFALTARPVTYPTAKVQSVDQGTLKIESTLTDDDPEDPIGPRNRFKLYSVKMIAGRTYTIDLVSGDFDAFLRLTGRRFEKLAEDDDGGGDLNSRIVFVPKTDGTYHVVATSLDNGLGAFTLTVREEK